MDMGPALPPKNIPGSEKSMCHKLGQPKRMDYVSWGVKTPQFSENYVEDVEEHHIG